MSRNKTKPNVPRVISREEHELAVWYEAQKKQIHSKNDILYKKLTSGNKIIKDDVDAYLRNKRKNKLDNMFG